MEITYGLSLVQAGVEQLVLGWLSRVLSSEVWGGMDMGEWSMGNGIGKFRGL